MYLRLKGEGAPGVNDENITLIYKLHIHYLFCTKIHSLITEENKNLISKGSHLVLEEII